MSAVKSDLARYELHAFIISHDQQTLTRELDKGQMVFIRRRLSVVSCNDHSKLALLTSQNSERNRVNMTQFWLELLFQTLTSRLMAEPGIGWLDIFGSFAVYVMQSSR
jgi:hypothetical protein